MAIIASVFSFRNSFQEIPYKVSREGSSKRDGGSGVVYIL